MDIYQPPQDCCTCQDTIWFSAPIKTKSIKVGDIIPLPMLINETLSLRNETIIQMGSIYIPSNAITPFYFAFENIFIVYFFFSFPFYFILFLFFQN